MEQTPCPIQGNESGLDPQQPVPPCTCGRSTCPRYSYTYLRRPGQRSRQQSMRRPRWPLGRTRDELLQAAQRRYHNLTQARLTAVQRGPSRPKNVLESLIAQELEKVKDLSVSLPALTTLYLEMINWNEDNVADDEKVDR